MKLIVSFLGSFLGIALILLIFGLIIYVKVKRGLKNLGYGNTREIINMIKEGEKSANYRKKSISGMSNILIPQILADFPNFNEKEFYNKVETSIAGILNSLNNNKVSKIKELAEIRSRLVEEIESRVNHSIKETYEDIAFHEHSLKSYKKDAGVLMIEVNSSLEFFYSKTINDKVVVSKKEYKKQTTFTTTYVYIYDPDKYNISKSSLSVHCPNCGAPLKNIDTHECAYCGSGVEDINLRSWYITKYKENY